MHLGRGRPVEDDVGNPTAGHQLQLMVKERTPANGHQGLGAASRPTPEAGTQTPGDDRDLEQIGTLIDHSGVMTPEWSELW